MIDLTRFAPELAYAVILGILAGFLWARIARVGVPLGILTTTSLAVIVAITMSPAGPFPDIGFVPGVCLTQHWGPGTLDELLTIGEPSLNVALFMPLGFFIAMHRRGVRRWALAGCALLPLLIELGQLMLPALGRYCDTMDISDNELGLVLGFGAGLILAWLAHLTRGLRRGRPATALD
jgi:hypothetical protein